MWAEAHDATVEALLAGPVPGTPFDVGSFEVSAILRDRLDSVEEVETPFTGARRHALRHIAMKKH
jgi:hypothetical protein